MATPWHNWWHCIGSTYGHWLRGDPRGWRTRHHREHVEGDYHHPPPPGTGADLLRGAQTAMQRPAVSLSVVERELVCVAMVERLLKLNVEVVVWVVTATHYHGLARFYPLAIQGPGMAMPGLCKANALQDGRDPWPRHALGLAKKHASHRLRENGSVHVGGIWAVRSKLEPIRDRQHQLAVVGYVRAHRDEGGFVWSIKPSSENPR